MIRHPKGFEREALFHLWQVCFGDEKRYIDFFFDNGYAPESCLIDEENGVPVSMLHLRFADFINGDKRESALYIYAAATLPEYRGRKIMANLIQSAVAYGKTLGCAFTFLLPASKGLYDYYGSLGFQDAFYIQKAAFTRKTLTQLGTISQGGDWDNSRSFYNSRIRAFKPVIQWREKEFSYALAEWKFTGGKILELSGGYALVRERSHLVEIKEFCGNTRELVDLLLSDFECDSFFFLLPARQKYPFQTELQRYGMLICEKPEMVETIIKASPYANLMLD